MVRFRKNWKPPNHLKHGPHAGPVTLRGCGTHGSSAMTTDLGLREWMNGMECNGMEWNGMEWNGMEWMNEWMNWNATWSSCVCYRFNCVMVLPYGDRFDKASRSQAWLTHQHGWKRTMNGDQHLPRDGELTPFFRNHVAPCVCKDESMYLLLEKWSFSSQLS